MIVLLGVKKFMDFTLPKFDVSGRRKGTLKSEQRVQLDFPNSLEVDDSLTRVPQEARKEESEI